MESTLNAYLCNSSARLNAFQFLLKNLPTEVTPSSKKMACFQITAESNSLHITKREFISSVYVVLKQLQHVLYYTVCTSFKLLFYPVMVK